MKIDVKKVVSYNPAACCNSSVLNKMKFFAFFAKIADFNGWTKNKKQQKNKILECFWY